MPGKTNARVIRTPAQDVAPRALDALPREVAAAVAAHLDQYDCACLALASRAMYVACIPRLHHTVVVDPSYTQYGRKNSNAHRCTYINLMYGLRCFLRVRPQVHSLRVIALPNLMNAHDDDTTAAIATFLRAQRRLRQLAWDPPTFQWAWLTQLPQPEMLVLLDISMAMSDAVAAATALYNKNGNSASARFSNLVHFRLSSPVLLAYFGQLEGGCTELRSLAVDRALRVRLWPPATELARNPAPDLDMGTVRCILTTPRPLLVDLTLSGVLVTEDDALCLQRTVRLPQLQRLVLHHVAECGPRVREGFLLAVAEHLHQVRTLHLDFREGWRDTVAPALEVIGKYAHLVALGLVVRVNNAKLVHNDAHHIYMAHARALAAFPRLHKLTLEVYQELAFCDLIVPTPNILGRSISRLQFLRSLQLHALSSDSLKGWLSPLSNLQYLDVQDASDIQVSPTLVVDRVMADPWTEAQRIGQQYLEANPSLISVRINTIVSGRDGFNVEVRDDPSVNRWFDFHMSVKDTIEV